MKFDSQNDEFAYVSNKFAISLLERRGRFLDLACGRGQLVKYARRLGLDALGLDIDPRGKPDIVADLNIFLPFHDETFDQVTCITSLEHIKNVVNVFYEVYRILKPGGCFIVTEPNLRWTKQHYTSFFTYSFLKSLITSVGFEIEKENHFIGLPLINRYLRFKRYFGFKLIPEFCYHFVFKLRKNISSNSKTK